jgi:hypothetical protein
VRLRYRMQSIFWLVMNCGNLSELYNMMPREEFKQFTGRNDPELVERYVIRVYSLAPLYMMQHWETRGIYATFKEWLAKNPA